MTCSGEVSLYCMIHRVYLCTAHHHLSHLRCPVVPKYFASGDHKCGDVPNTVMFGNCRTVAPLPLTEQGRMSIIRKMVATKDRERPPRRKEESLPEVQFKEE